ncbi:MAG: class I tRNA ligase family protein [Rhodospirillales bacterium]
MRWLLGGLAGFSEAERVARDDMPELERLMLHRVAELDRRVRDATDSYDWTGVGRTCIISAPATFRRSISISARTRCIATGRTSLRRRACRTVLDILHRCLCTWLAPTLCFYRDEAWTARFGHEGSVHLELYPEIPLDWHDAALAARWSRCAISAARSPPRSNWRAAAGQLGASLQAAVSLGLPREDPDLLDALLLDAEQWAEIAIVSDLRLPWRRRSASPSPWPRARNAPAAGAC